MLVSVGIPVDWIGVVDGGEVMNSEVIDGAIVSTGKRTGIEFT